MSAGRNFPTLVREYEDPRSHWSPDWMVVGALGGSIFLLALIVLLWWIF